jgi:hypothetical protein
VAREGGAMLVGGGEGSSKMRSSEITEPRVMSAFQVPAQRERRVMNSNRGGYSHQRCEESKDAEYRSCNRQMECLTDQLRELKIVLQE